MAPPTASIEFPQLTASDMNFLKAAVICFTQPPNASSKPSPLQPFHRPSANVIEIQMDKEKMAELLGVKSRSIDHRWWAIRKKLGQQGEVATNAPATPKAGRKTSSLTPKKRGLAPEDDGEDDDEDFVKPKRGKKAGPTGPTGKAAQLRPKRGIVKKEEDAPETKAKKEED